MSPRVEVVTVQMCDLRNLLREVLAEGLAEERNRTTRGAQVLSCSQAARLAKRRRADVAEAMRAGDLKAHRRGRTWRTTASEVQAWVDCAARIVGKGGRKW